MKHLPLKLLMLLIAFTLSSSIMAQMSLEYNTTLGSGASIGLQLQGTVNCTVNWGDGNSETFTTVGGKYHTYEEEGTYTVTISGSLTQFGAGENADPNNSIKKLVKINSFGNIGLTSLSGAFSGADNLSEVPSTLPSTITDLSYTFRDMEQVSITNLNNWDVSNVTDMAYMFAGTYNFNQNIGAWNVSSVTNMAHMLSSAHNFNQDISNWIVSSVTDMSRMFSGATSFNQDIGNWNVSSVMDMSYMFNYASSFNQDISDWTISNVVNMTYMFYYASNFNQNINTNNGHWVVSSVTNMSNMFNHASSFNQNINSWDVSSVTDMSWMFSNASSFNQDIGAWNVSNVTDMSYMFYGSTFNQDIGGWTVTNVTTMERMLSSTFDQDLSSWVISSVTNLSGFFRDLSSTVDLNIAAWNTSTVTDMSFLLAGFSTEYKPDISGWNISNVITMEGMFQDNSKYDIDLSSWDVSNVENMSRMFENATFVTNNIDITGWTVNNATNMSYMFKDNEAFNQDISSWTVSNVTDMSYMFYCSSLTDNLFDQDIGGWNTSNVTNMAGMFYGSDFNQDISNWNTSNVIYMASMFSFAENFNQNINTNGGHWDMSNVESIQHMFRACNSFDQDLSDWDISKVEYAEEAFAGTSLSDANYSNMLISWAALNLVDDITIGISPSQYTPAAEAARASIIADDNWIINDGGAAGSYIWEGNGKSADWNVASNWNENAVPNSGNNVVIPMLYAGSDVYIGTGETGNCNNLQVNTGGILNIESGASFINQGSITDHGTINVMRTISDGKWHLISSPNNNTTSGTFLGDYLQTWDEPTATWSDIAETTTLLPQAKGFSLWGVVDKATTHTFTGTPNTGDISTAITNTDQGPEPIFEGANLLGNPYPSSIDWDFLHEIYGSVYIWDSSEDDYKEWNGSGTGVQYIPPMQGFFIVTIESSPATFEISNNARTHTNANNYYKASKASNAVVLHTSNGSFEDKLYIGFDQNSSAEFELQKDAYKFLSSTSGVPQLYSYSGETMLAIDVRPEVETIQLGYKNSQNGDYSIGINDMDHISSVILEDTKTESLHNLINSDYEFEWNITDEEQRFKLHLEATGINDILSQNIQLYAHNKTLYIQSKERLNNAQITIVDMMGRVVYEENLINGQNESIALDLENGTYIAQLASDNGTQVEKVVLQ